MHAFSSLVLPISSLLQQRVLKRYPLGQALLMSLYGLLIFSAAVHKLNPFVNFTHITWIAVSQLPWVYMRATKNNVIGAFVGAGYEKVCARPA